MPTLSSLSRIPLGLLLAATLAMSVPTPSPALTVGTDGKPVTNDAGVTFGVLAHRGGGQEWPENSVEAYTHSVAEGFDTIETDIVFTRDGHGVMSHYDLLPDRCTQAGQSIHSLTLAQVEQVRCADLAGDKVVPIPTFEQLADILAGQTATGLTLDIKNYPGQSSAGKRSWAERAIKLVKRHGLLAQTSILTFNWAEVLPVIRTYAPRTYVLALDHGAVDLDRVRLAARLGADGFGIKMKYTSTFLAGYIKAKGMDATPWEVLGAEQRAFSIFYGGKRQLFSTDTPTVTRTHLVNGDIDLNPVPKPTTSTLASRVRISSGTYVAGRRQYKAVGTAAVPASALPMLRDVTLSVTVTGGTGKGILSVGASSSPLSSSTTVALPKGTATLSVKAPLGDGRKLRIYTTRTVKLTVDVVGYTRVRFPAG